MKGNFHVRFLGEGVTATSPPYPTPNSKGFPIGFPDDLPLLELVGPRDQFRDDVIDDSHIVEHAWFDGLRLPNTSIRCEGLMHLIVKVLFETPQHLRGDLDVSRSGCLHKIQSMGETSDADAAGRFACEGATLVHSMHRQPLGLTRFFGRHRMRPRITESQAGCGFFRRELTASLDNGAQRVAHKPGVFAIGVIDAPELVARLRHENVVRFHTAIRADAASSVVPIAHKMLCVVMRGLLRHCCVRSEWRIAQAASTGHVAQFVPRAYIQC